MEQRFFAYYDNKAKIGLRSKKGGEKISKDSRIRHACFVAYPESAPELLQIIDSWHIKACAILHDKDFRINEETGELESVKPHWHCIVSFTGKKSTEQILDLISELNISYFEKINDMTAMCRYFLHLDQHQFDGQPAKHLYSAEEVICFGGFDFFGIIDSKERRQEVLCEIIEYCRANNVTSFAKLVDYAMAERPDFFQELARHNTYFVREYIRSRARTLN